MPIYTKQLGAHILKKTGRLKGKWVPCHYSHEVCLPSERVFNVHKVVCIYLHVKGRSSFCPGWLDWLLFSLTLPAVRDKVIVLTKTPAYFGCLKTQLQLHAWWHPKWNRQNAQIRILHRKKTFVYTRQQCLRSAMLGLSHQALIIMALLADSLHLLGLHQFVSQYRRTV